MAFFEKKGGAETASKTELAPFEPDVLYSALWTTTGSASNSQTKAGTEHYGRNLRQAAREAFCPTSLLTGPGSTPGGVLEAILADSPTPEIGRERQLKFERRRGRR